MCQCEPCVFCNIAQVLCSDFNGLKTRQPFQIKLLEIQENIDLNECQSPVNPAGRKGLRGGRHTHQNSHSDCTPRLRQGNQSAFTNQSLGSLKSHDLMKCCQFQDPFHHIDDHFH